MGQDQFESSSIGTMLQPERPLQGCFEQTQGWKWEFESGSNGKFFVRVQGDLPDGEKLRLFVELSAESVKRLGMWLAEKATIMSAGG